MLPEARTEGARAGKLHAGEDEAARIRFQDDKHASELEITRQSGIVGMH